MCHRYWAVTGFSRHRVLWATAITCDLTQAVRPVHSSLCFIVRFGDFGPLAPAWEVGWGESLPAPRSHQGHLSWCWKGARHRCGRRWAGLRTCASLGFASAPGAWKQGVENVALHPCLRAASCECVSSLKNPGSVFPARAHGASATEVTLGHLLQPGPQPCWQHPLCDHPFRSGSSTSYQLSQRI